MAGASPDQWLEDQSGGMSPSSRSRRGTSTGVAPGSAVGEQIFITYRVVLNPISQPKCREPGDFGRWSGF